MNRLDVDHRRLAELESRIDQLERALEAPPARPIPREAMCTRCRGTRLVMACGRCSYDLCRACIVETVCDQSFTGRHAEP